MAIFEKRAGAPTGTINLRTGKNSYTITDGGTFTATDTDDVASLRDHPYVQLQGGTGGAYVAPPVVASVFLKDGVLTSGADGLPINTAANTIRTVIPVGYSAGITPALPSVGDAVYNVGTLTGNLTVNAPSGTPLDGQMIRLRLKLDGSPRTVTWNSIFQWTTTTPQLQVPTAANSEFTVLWEYVANATKWRARGCSVV